MNIVISPDSFKGTLRSEEVANSIEKGMKKVFPHAFFEKFPIADGGEGTLETLVNQSGGKKFYQRAKDPLGRDIQGYWGLMGDNKTAIIEMAIVSGLPLLKKEERNPLVTSTYGTGQLMKSALDFGISKLLIAIGGSATVDGGAGMIQALGGKFLDENNNEIKKGGGNLKKLKKIDLSHFDTRIFKTDVLVACDVDNPLIGPNGAARIYGPQKGANQEMVEILEDGLTHFSQIIEKDLGIDIAFIKGAGAAGGLGAGLVGICKAILTPGIDLIIDILELEEKIAKADLVITGEGKIDHQSSQGKVLSGIAKLGKKYNIPVIAIGGSTGDGASTVHNLGISSYFSALKSAMKETDIQKEAANMIIECSEEVARLLKTGINFKNRG